MISQNKPNSNGGGGGRGTTPGHSTATTVNQKTADNPRFLVIKRLDEADFSKISPFLIYKALYGLIGEAKSIRKTHEGLLIETSSNAQSKRLSEIERLAEYPVTVVPHNTLNYSKGVIFCRDFLNCSVTEIEENLKDKGVLAVKRIQMRREGVLIDTPNLILTFDTPKLPKYINAAMYRLEVRPFIPNPLRCFRCQQFGHTSARCNKDEICICGMPRHDRSPCSTPICVNCKGEHFAQDKKCPKFKEEQEIQKIKTVENITYSEARKRIVVTTPTPGVSFAQTVQSSIKDQLKDLIAQITPEITKICTQIIKDQSETQTPSLTKRTKPPGLFARSLSNVSKSDKRKAEESDESDDIQSSSSQMPAPTSKRKPGRPPKKSSQNKGQKPRSDTDSMEISQGDLSLKLNT